MEINPTISCATSIERIVSNQRTVVSPFFHVTPPILFNLRQEKSFFHTDHGNTYLVYSGMSRVAQNLLLLSLPSSVSSTNLDHRRFICDRLQKLRVYRAAFTHRKPFRVYSKLRKTNDLCAGSRAKRISTRIRSATTMLARENQNP